MNNLCDWSQIDRLVKNRAANGDLNDIWNDAWKDWMIPYTCDASLYISEEENWESHNNDVEVIQSWIYNRDKLQTLMPTTGENLVIFLLKKDVKKATDLLNDFLDMTGKQWVELSPLCTELGIRKLFKLQIINDLDASLKVLRCANEAKYLDMLNTLLRYWTIKTPTIRDNLMQWNKLAAYRAYSSMLFQNSCRKRKIQRELYRINYQLRLNIVDAALNQKHRYIAEKHLNYVKQTKGWEEKLNLLLLFDARIKRLCADVETNMNEKMLNYTDSWKKLHKLLKNDELDDNTSTAIREHIGTMASKIEFLSRENDDFAKQLARNSTILQDIGVEQSARLSKIREHLLLYSLNNLRYCCTDTTIANVGEHYCALAKHCYDRLMSIDAENDEIFQEFLLSTLRSMHYDYPEATHYFPCLLKPERLQDNETRETFVQECAKLRPWLFLRWRDLLFSHLGTPSIATIILPIVHKLAETYPDAVVYTYRFTVERNSAILQDEKIQQIRRLLGNKAEEYERFIQAVQYVVQPKLYLKHYLNEAIKDLSRGKTVATAILWLLQKVYPNSITRVAEEKALRRPGNIFNEIARYEKEIKSLSFKNFNAARKGLQSLKELLNKDINESLNKNINVKLKNYSPFLHEYVGGYSGGIEIPGQYIDDRESVPRYHVKIARFEPQVEVMRSLRKPIRIGMVGDNGREYKFLVKFGEDLTLDRSLQQLYSTMNRTLRNDLNCRQRRLAIDTYEVYATNTI